MPQVCLYFQLHQPYRLTSFSVFDLDQDKPYFVNTQLDENQVVFQKVAAKSYVPMLTLLTELVATYPDFCFAVSCSGVFLEQAQHYEPQVIDLLQQLAASGQVEFLAETYYHSLASLYSAEEFTQQVVAHDRLIKKLFQVTPRVFRNTELIYSNRIAELVAALKYPAMLTEAVDRYLHGRSRTQLFTDVSKRLTLLLKHADLSDDIAFRFSDRQWPEYPLSVEKYITWLEVHDEQQLVNLFMDFETFGEHQWAETGIFEFFAELVTQIVARPGNTFITPSQVVETVVEPARQVSERLTSLLPVYDVPLPISWADVDRDLTAWIDNPFQQDTLRLIYELEPLIKARHNKHLTHVWRQLQTSDHFYYMCTKWSADGDVHAYFSPYESPYEAYRRYSIVLADLKNEVAG